MAKRVQHQTHASIYVDDSFVQIANCLIMCRPKSVEEAESWIESNQVRPRPVMRFCPWQRRGGWRKAAACAAHLFVEPPLRLADVYRVFRVKLLVQDCYVLCGL